MTKYCDLHTHSYFSDGTFSPAQLVEAAKAAGLQAVALCDHNTVAGLTEFMEAGQGSGVQTVPGVEFSTDYRGTELHILALFVQPKSYGIITELLEEGQRQKEKSNKDLVEALAKAGYVLDYEQVKASGKGRINRAHIAAALTQVGYTASVADAFKNLLSPKHGFYHPPKLPDALQIIPFIRSLGCVSVWAHPFLSLKTAQAVEEFLRQAVPVGLDAMETMYSKYDEAQTAAAKALAEQYGILQSGGSDFHGANKPDIQIGTGRGNLRIPVSLLEGLQKNMKIFE